MLHKHLVWTHLKQEIQTFLNKIMATYQDVYARIRPDMAEGAVGRVMNVSDKTPSDIIAEQRDIAEKKQIKENSYRLQQQYGYGPDEATSIAQRMVSVNKQAKQVEIKKQLLAADQAEYDLKSQQDKLNTDSLISEMKRESEAINANNIVGHEKEINNFRNKYWGILTSRDPNAREQAGMIISQLNEENKRQGDLAEAHIMSLGIPKEAAHGIALSSVNERGEYDPSLGQKSVDKYIQTRVETRAQLEAAKKKAIGAKAPTHKQIVEESGLNQYHFTLPEIEGEPAEDQSGRVRGDYIEEPKGFFGGKEKVFKPNKQGSVMKVYDRTDPLKPKTFEVPSESYDAIYQKLQQPEESLPSTTQEATTDASTSTSPMSLGDIFK